MGVSGSKEYYLGSAELISSPFSITKTYPAKDNFVILSSEEQSLYFWQKVKIFMEYLITISPVCINGT